MIDRTTILVQGEHELLPALVKYYVEIKKAQVCVDDLSPEPWDFGVIGINSQSIPDMATDIEFLMDKDIPILALINSDIYPCTKELPAKSRHGMTEDDDIVITPWDVTPVKYLAAEAMLKKHKKPVIVLRTFDAYGPEVPGTLTHWVNMAMKGAALPVIGDGEQKRTFLYVDDFLEVLPKVEHKLLTGCSGTYNIGATEAISYKRLGYYVWTMIYGTDEGLKFVNLPNCETHSWKIPNIQSIQDWVGWRPQVSLRRGLFNLISHVQKDK